MNFLTHILSEELTFALGSTLLHSIWQGAAVALFLVIIQLGIQRSSSNSKYLIGIAAMFLIFVLSVVTFFHSYQSKTELKAELPQIIVAESNISQATELTDEFTFSENNDVESGINSLANFFYRNLTLIVSFWLIGLIIQSFRFAGGFIYNQRLKVKDTKNVSIIWEKQFQTLCQKIVVSQPVRLMESALIKIPIVIGHLKPVILVPIGLLTQLPQNQVEAILMHELAHIKRKDYLLNLFQSIIDVLFFYHPAVRWISSFVSEHRENCCDDVVVKIFGDKLSFAKALANIQSSQFEAHNYAVAAIGKNKKLFQRISRLFSRPQTNSGLTEKLTSILVIALCFVTVAAYSQSFFNTQEFRTNSGIIPILPDIQTFQSSSNSTYNPSRAEAKAIRDSVKQEETEEREIKNTETRIVKIKDRFVVSENNLKQDKEKNAQIKNETKNKATLIFPANKNKNVLVQIEKKNLKELYLDKIRIYDWELDNYWLLMNEFVKPHFEYMKGQNTFKKYLPVLNDEYEKIKDRFEKSLAHKKMLSKEFHVSMEKSRQMQEELKRFDEFERQSHLEGVRDRLIDERMSNDLRKIDEFEKQRQFEEERVRLVDEYEHRDLDKEREKKIKRLHEFRDQEEHEELISKLHEIKEIEELEKLKEELILNEIELSKTVEDTLVESKKEILKSKKNGIAKRIDELEKKLQFKKQSFQLDNEKAKLEKQIQKLKTIVEEQKHGERTVPKKELQKMKQEIQEMEKNLQQVHEENNIRKRKRLDIYEAEKRRAVRKADRGVREKRRMISEANEKFLVNELLNDGLIDNEENYSFELTNKHLKINKKKQPKKVFEKYKKIVTLKFGVKFKGKTKFVISTR